MLGALGELDLGTSVSRPRRRAPPDVSRARSVSTTFLLDARNGILGDLDDALTSHVAGDVVAGQAGHRLRRRASGDLAGAQRLLDDATRELVSLGFADFASLGEGRVHRELQPRCAAAAVGAAGRRRTRAGPPAPSAG